jgi:hypothetical protein
MHARLSHTAAKAVLIGVMGVIALLALTATARAAKNDPHCSMVGIKNRTGQTLVLDSWTILSDRRKKPQHLPADHFRTGPHSENIQAWGGFRFTIAACWIELIVVSRPPAQHPVRVAVYLLTIEQPAGRPCEVLRGPVRCSVAFDSARGGVILTVSPRVGAS